MLWLEWKFIEDCFEGVKWIEPPVAHDVGGHLFSMFWFNLNFLDCSHIFIDQVFLFMIICTLHNVKEEEIRSISNTFFFRQLCRDWEGL
jgi:hypothetical protein